MDQQLQQKIETFFSQYKSQKYKRGEILVRADDNPPGIFYIREGFVKEYAITKKGDELVVNIFKPFSFFPMSWAMNETPNEYFFEAMTDLVVWRAPKEAVVSFIKINPDVLYNLLGRVYKGTDGLLTRLTYLMSGGAYPRLITELLIHAKRFGKGQGVVTVKISEKDIASSSGLTRETVSREMKILKDKGIVTYSKNVLTVKNLVSLEDELLTSA